LLIVYFSLTLNRTASGQAIFSR